MISIDLPMTNKNTLDDESLASQAIHQPQAFSELYRRHFQAIYRYHLARCGSVAEAEDLTTITFVAALEGLSSYRQRGSFCAWLFGIARRQLAMHFRSRKREIDLESAPEVVDPAPLPEAIAGQRLQIAQLTQALGLLNHDRREALILCLFSELSAEEASRIMGKSPAAVKMLLFRGLRDLRELFGNTLEADA